MAKDYDPDNKKPQGSGENEELEDLLGKISESSAPRDKRSTHPEEEEIIKKPSGSSDENENIDSWIEKIAEKEAETPEEMGIITRLLSLVTQPTALFRYLREKPDIIVPIALTLIMAVTVSFVTYDAQIDKQVETIGKMDSNIFDADTRDEMAAQIETSRSGMQRTLAIFGYTPVGVLFGLGFFSLIFWFVGRILLGGSASYLQTFSATGYATLISSVFAMLIKLPFLINQRVVDVDFSLARLLPNGDHGNVVYRLLSGIDPFIIWTVVVLGIGIAVVNRLSVTKGIVTMVSLWVIFLLVFNAGIMGVMHNMGII